MPTVQPIDGLADLETVIAELEAVRVVQRLDKNATNSGDSETKNQL